MIFIYIVCESEKEAKKIGKKLLKKRLAVCINIFPQMISMYFWPPKSGKIEEANEVVLIVKTEDNKFEAVEKEVCKLHSYDVPFIGAIKLEKVHQLFLSFLRLRGELE